jgi:hypothetical protein
MTNTPTPGQLAYDAWWIGFGDAPPRADAYAMLTPRAHRAWEAAAQAVRTQSQTAQGVTLHTMLAFLIASATPEDLDAVHLWLSEATASLRTEMQDYPDEEDE